MGVVGLSKIGRFGRWSQVYSTGETKPVSWLWSIAPERFRSYWLFIRHIPKTPSFDELLERSKQ